MAHRPAVITAASRACPVVCQPCRHTLTILSVAPCPMHGLIRQRGIKYCRSQEASSISRPFVSWTSPLHCSRPSVATSAKSKTNGAVGVPTPDDEGQADDYGQPEDEDELFDEGDEYELDDLEEQDAGRMAGGTARKSAAAAATGGRSRRQQQQPGGGGGVLDEEEEDEMAFDEEEEDFDDDDLEGLDEAMALDESPELYEEFMRETRKAAQKAASSTEGLAALLREVEDAGLTSTSKPPAATSGKSSTFAPFNRSNVDERLEDDAGEEEMLYEDEEFEEGPQGKDDARGVAGGGGSSSGQGDDLYGEGEGFDDEGGEADTQGGGGEDEEDQFPSKPEERVYKLAALFDKAALLDLSERMLEEHPNLLVSGLQSDAMKVVPGDMYFYMPTPEDDSFAMEEHHTPLEICTAVVNGAIAIVVPKAVMPLPQGCDIPSHVPLMPVVDVEHVAQQTAVAFYDAPARELATVAVTGSYGKTTVSWLVRGIMEQLEQLAGMIGTVEYALAEVRLDEDGNVWKPAEEDPCEGRVCSAPFVLAPYAGKYGVPMTTPQGLHLQKLMAGMRDRGAQCLVAECSTQALSRGYCQWLDVNVVVWTNLSAAGGSPEVVQELGSRDAIFQAQMELFDKLDDPTEQAAVINLDDPAAQMARERAGQVPVVTYAVLNPEADVSLQSVSYSLWETEMVVKTPNGKLQIITSLLGEHNVYNVLAAVATGVALRVPLKAIVAGIEAVELVPGRCEIIDVLEGQEFPVVVDAASTPESLQEILMALQSAQANRIFLVMGCPGEVHRDQRSKMAEVAHALSDVVIFTNDSPRREDASSIIEDLMNGLPEEMVHKYSSFVYNPFQDQHNVPLWFEPYLQKAQQTCKRYIMEDRFSAIRAAIGTAAAGDAVVITGRGHIDYVEHADEEGTDVLRGWFDDRAEAAHALSKLQLLYGLKRLDRKQLPWGNTLEEMDTVNVIDQLHK